jgi:hypothetical protein
MSEVSYSCYAIGGELIIGGYDYGGAGYELGGEVGADYAEYDE